MAARECPSAEYFAWVSDHDRWHPRWLERLVAELDARRRRGARVSDHAADGARRARSSRRGRGCSTPRRATDLGARWRQFCREGVGSGDMVYGLMRVDALRQAGIFRPRAAARSPADGRADAAGPHPPGAGGAVVPPAVETARASSASGSTLVLAGDEPRWFSLAAVAAARARAVARVRGRAGRRRCRGSRAPRGPRMLLRYQVTYALAALPQDRNVARLGPVQEPRHAGEEARQARLASRRLSHAGGRCASLRGKVRRGPAAPSTSCSCSRHRLGLRRGETPSSR